MAAANTNATNATKAAAEEVKAAASKATTQTAAATKAAADKANANASKMTEETVAQMKAVSEKARQGSAEMTDKALENFEKGSKQFEENAARIQEFNAAMAESSKAGTRAAVDQYETAAKGLFDLQRKLAGSAKSDWVKDAATAQIQFAEDVTAAWAKASRNLLK